MKIANLILVIILLTIMTECNGNIQSNNELIKVDVSKSSYHKKELILQDFMDVEYVPLETTDSFINQGFIQAVGKNFILLKNRNPDGDIFVYDRTGKALRKINHKGQGNGEYTNIFNITLDEGKEEMFINDIFTKKILVYDICGKFKRSFNQKVNADEMAYRDIFNFDRDNLICYDQFNKEIAFFLISKQDGNITKEIKIPFKEKKSLTHQFIDKVNNTTFTVGPGPYSSIIPYYNDNWILSEISSDTVYTIFPDYNLHPFIAKTPSIQSMNPEVFLILRLLSSRYYLMESIKNVYDSNTNDKFPKTFIMYDREEKTMFNYTVYNGDFLNKEEIHMDMTRPINHEIESWYPLDANQLVESYKKGELKGKLKEIASKLKEDDNPVIMLIKHKNKG